MHWEALGSALALVLIIEGIGPFAAPRLWRRAMMQLGLQSDTVLRLFGASMMIGGVLLLSAL